MAFTVEDAQSDRSGRQCDIRSGDDCARRIQSLASRTSAYRTKWGSGTWKGSHAYAVIAGTLTVTIKGETIVRTGTLAYTFSKRGEAWKIDAQAWGRTS